MPKQCKCEVKYELRPENGKRRGACGKCGAIHFMLMDPVLFHDRWEKKSPEEFHSLESHLLFKLYEVDNGFCQVNYTAHSLDGNAILNYCIQKNFDDCRLMRGSRYDFEPAWQLWLNPYYDTGIEIPTGDERIEDDVRKFLETGKAFELMPETTQEETNVGDQAHT